MGGDGVSDVSAGVDGMVNGTSLSSGACGGGDSYRQWVGWGWRGFLEGDRDGLGKKVLGCWIQGEDMETFPTTTQSTWVCLTGSQHCNRHRCRICPIHHPANSLTSSCTNFTYPITTHADSKSMNLIYKLQCTECNAFYIEKPIVPFQLLSTHNPTRSLSKNAGMSVSNYQTSPQTTSAANLKLHTTSSSNANTPQFQHPLTPPHSTLASAVLKNFTSVSCILLLRKASVFGPKYSFSFRFHLYMS